MFVWGLLLAILYILRPFLLLIFLTFVFAYVQAHGTQSLKHRISNRPLRVTIIGLVFLGTIVATVFVLLPQVEQQAGDLIDNRQNYINGADRGLNDKLREHPAIWDYLREGGYGDAEIEDAASTDGDAAEPVPGVADAQQDTPPNDEGTEDAIQAPPPPGEPRIVQKLVNSLLGLGGDSSPEQTIRRVFDFGSSLFAYLSSFLLSVLFSFLIVLDLPKLQHSVKRLAHTKIGFIYTEVADNISTFAQVLGRALEAQLFIAVTNTILTSMGMWVLGLTGNIPVLAAIVFLCSFIPVAGVFISSTPICLLALQSEGGFILMIWAIVMILVVHAVETYILNPKIYGHHMRMNPVLVLIVLTICGKLFGIWGLILGIPITNYIFRHAIRNPEDRPVDAAH